MKKIILILTLTIILAEGMFASSDETAPENCPVPVLCALGALNIPACKNVKEVYQYKTAIGKSRVANPEKVYVLEDNQIFQYKTAIGKSRVANPEKVYVLEDNQIFQYKTAIGKSRVANPEKIYVLEVE